MDNPKNEKENIEPQADALDSNNDNVAEKVKSLSHFLNCKGHRKTLEELIDDSSKLPAVMLSPGALSFDIISSDDDDEEEETEDEETELIVASS